MACSLSLAPLASFYRWRGRSAGRTIPLAEVDRPILLCRTRRHSPNDIARVFLDLHSGIEAGIKMFCKDFAVWRKNHVHVACRHLKNRQATESNRSPMCSLAFGVSCAGEHRNMTRIGPGNIASVCPRRKPIVIRGTLWIRNGTPQTKPEIKQPTPQIKQRTPHNRPNKSQSPKK